MKQVKIFFEQLGFDFNQDLKAPHPAPISDNVALSEKLIGNLFFYKSATQANASFYLLSVPLSRNEFQEFRNYIWNENKADLLFVLGKDGLFDKIELYYAKTSPAKAVKLDGFRISGEEESRLEDIKKWRFDSGAFWLKYFEELKKHQTKSIDKELVKALYDLKQKLGGVPRLENNEPIIQALIDRTLYIKYLEDNHIINSYFYEHYFQEKTLQYKDLLEERRVDDINKLFSNINGIFNNDLFDTPEIKRYYFTDEVCRLIYDSISGTDLHTGQLRLFDFKFNIIPIELISYIYEVFLSEVQKKNGIYYTPKKLAQLIVDDVIPEGGNGTVLDPACGSGMFLSVALNRLIENTATKTPRSVEKEIEHRLKLLRNNIFGVEKLEVARRFTVFSLSLQAFRNLSAEKVRDFIANQLEQFGEVRVFRDNSFHGNVKCQNTLSLNNPPFEGVTFDYILGNPPFFEIKADDEEVAFLRDYKLSAILDKDVSADYVVGSNQISQCFFIKIKDWANSETRFGFVSNSSNFYDNSSPFQQYFYSFYGLEKVYELSRVKEILFEKAKESVIALVFNSKPKSENVVTYYPVNMEMFSEKPFELLVVKEDVAISIKQGDLINEEVRLRDYLVGSEYDFDLVRKVYSSASLMEDFLLKRSNGQLFIHTGGQLAGVDKILETQEISREEYDNNKAQYLAKYTKQYTRPAQSKEFNTPFISYKDLAPFKVHEPNVYVKNNSQFRRKGYSDDIYVGERILWSRLNKQINAVYCSEQMYFDFDVHVIKIKEPQLYHLFTAILNSELVNYIVNINLRKRFFDNHSKIGIKEFCNIPIPKLTDKELVGDISQLSSTLNGGKEYTTSNAEKLNELIYDLYDLSYTERQRIKDYFLPNDNLNKRVPKEYKESLIDTIGMFLNNGLENGDIEFSDRIANLRIVKVSLNGRVGNNPPAKYLGYKILSEVFEQGRGINYLASQEKVWGKDCVYIIRKNEVKEWTETKAYEDGQEILKRLKHE